MVGAAIKNKMSPETKEAMVSELFPLLCLFPPLSVRLLLRQFRTSPLAQLAVSHLCKSNSPSD